MQSDLIRQANELQSNGRWAEAKSTWEVISRDNEFSFWPEYWIAMCDAHLGRHQVALDKIRSVTPPSDGERLTLQLAEIEVLLMKGEHETACSIFENLYTNNAIDFDQRRRIANWIITLRLDTKEYPRSVFEMEEWLTNFIRVKCA